MSLAATFQNDIQNAMRAKDATRLATLRSILAAFKIAQTAGTGEPTESDYLNLIKKQAKQRKESIAQFRDAGREDLVSKEEAELAIIETYLPTMMSEEDVKKVIADKKAALGITERSDMGKLMGALMGELKDKADGGMVKKLTEESFGG